MRNHVFAVSMAALACALTATTLQAQSTPAGGTMTLTEAIALAQRNNPTLQNSVNGRRTAAAQMRSANGALLPNLNTSFSTGFREGRQSFVQGQAFGSTNDQLSTDVSASASLSLSMATFNDRKSARANQDAAESDISAAEQRVKIDVTNQYLTALQAQARAALQDTLLATTALQLQLARARLQVGSGTQLDVQQAEVADGQQRVAALNQRNQAAIEMLRLFQQIGIPPVAGTMLDQNLPATPTLDVATVQEMARKSNPQLEALRARGDAADYSIASAKSAYYPSLSLSAGVGGTTNRYTNTGLLVDQGMASATSRIASCIRTEEVRAALSLDNKLSTCQGFAFSPADEADIRNSQSKYPFGFGRNPYNLSATFSLPIFNGFRREQQIEQARVTRRNSDNDLRGQQLRIAADVDAAFLLLSAAQQTVVLQEQNVRTARTALALAQERYRVGLASIVDLQQARGDFERAETDRISALYDVQRQFTALEAAVGRPLR